MALNEEAAKLKEQLNPNDPSEVGNLAQWTEKYNGARADYERFAQAMAKRLGDGDPLVQEIRATLASLPRPDAPFTASAPATPPVTVNEQEPVERGKKTVEASDFVKLGGVETIRANTPDAPQPAEVKKSAGLKELPAAAATGPADDCAGPRLDAAVAAMQESRSYLSSPAPTVADVQAAAAAARRAQRLAPPCISQQVSSLTGPINRVLVAIQQVEREARQAQREANRAAMANAMAGLSASLTGVMNTAIAARNAPQPSVSPTPGPRAVDPQVQTYIDHLRRPPPTTDYPAQPQSQSAPQSQPTSQSRPTPEPRSQAPVPPPVTCQECSIRESITSGDKYFYVAPQYSRRPVTAACPGGTNFTVYVIMSRKYPGVATGAAGQPRTDTLEAARQSARQLCPRPQ